MSIFNIRDHRTSDKETRVDVVFEVDCKDWSNLGLPRDSKNWVGWTANTSIYDASVRAIQIKGLVTLYFYDKGKIKRDFEEITWIHPDIEERPFDPQEALKQKLIGHY